MDELPRPAGSSGEMVPHQPQIEITQQQKANTAWKTALVLVGSGLLQVAATFFSNYLQARGYLSVDLARFFLAVSWFAISALIIIGVKAFGLKHSGLIITAGVIILTATLFSLEMWAPKLKPGQLSAVALYVDCDFQGFPIRIPPSTTIHVLMVHPRILKRNDELWDVTSPDDKARIWPSEQEAIARPLNVGERLYKAFSGMKCTVKKYGDPTVDNIVIPISLNYYRSRPYNLVVDPLTSNGNFSEFVFYLVNACGYTAAVGQISTTASVHVLGERDRRIVSITFPARKLYLNLFLPGSQYSWPNLGGCSF